jgi:glycosyltransferase involved in cell wall biosynthesis
VCESCLGKTLPLAGAVHKCYRGDRAASAVTAAMLGAHRLARTYHRAVDVYVALTEFARAKFVQGGFPANKIVVKPNFILEDRGPGTGGGGYALYVGRLDEGKGIEVLLPAWQQVRGDFELRILGDGMLAPLVRAAAERDPRIRYLGRQPMDEVFAAMGEAAFMVLSSVWYEGLPKTVVEAYSRGTPIVASALEALAELIEPGKDRPALPPGRRRGSWPVRCSGTGAPAALAACVPQLPNAVEERYSRPWRTPAEWMRVTGVQSGSGTLQRSIEMR